MTTWSRAFVTAIPEHPRTVRFSCADRVPPLDQVAVTVSDVVSAVEVSEYQTDAVGGSVVSAPVTLV